jgi:hypothetical protein
LVGEESGRLTLFAHSHHIVHPLDPEATELASVQNVGRFIFGHIGFGAILADYGSLILPTTDEHFEHGFGLHWAGGEGDVGIVGRTHFEVDDATVDGVEVVLQFVFGVAFYGEKVEKKYVINNLLLKRALVKIITMSNTN